MNKTLFLKIGKMGLKVSIATLKFSARIVVDTFLRYSEKKRDFNRWQNDYDEHTREVTGKGPFW